jgi:hypothetical protein
MARNGRRKSKPFVQIYKDVLQSDEYARLSPRAVKLLLDILAQYNGSNNGDFTCAFGVMKRRGWKSPNTLRRACLELEDAGFLERTRQGGRNKCNLHASSFYAIDECGGKLDRLPTRKPSNLWRDQVRIAPKISLSSPKSVST